MKIGHAQRFSRVVPHPDVKHKIHAGVFPHPDVKHSILAGMDPAWLSRWNGFPGTVGRSPLEGDAMGRAEKILWAREPKTTVMALIPAASGTGSILFAQLDLQARLDPSKDNFDPVAERLLLNLLGQANPQ